MRLARGQQVSNPAKNTSYFGKGPERGRCEGDNSFSMQKIRVDFIKDKQIVLPKKSITCAF